MANTARWTPWQLCQWLLLLSHQSCSHGHPQTLLWGLCIQATLLFSYLYRLYFLGSAGREQKISAPIATRLFNILIAMCSPILYFFLWMEMIWMDRGESPIKSSVCCDTVLRILLLEKCRLICIPSFLHMLCLAHKQSFRVSPLTAPRLLKNLSRTLTHCDMRRLKIVWNWSGREAWAHSCVSCQM